jgi:hypothetical protein
MGVRTESPRWRFDESQGDKAYRLRVRLGEDLSHRFKLEPPPFPVACGAHAAWWHPRLVPGSVLESVLRP